MGVPSAQILLFAVLPLEFYFLVKYSFDQCLSEKSGPQGLWRRVVDEAC
jgi:hypothetical protein